jgi:hypothetical protein
MTDTFDLKTETEALLRRFGAEELPDVTHYPFTFLCTRGGPLHVAPYDDFIACRFEWAKVAHGRVSGPVNPNSGKWNWHSGRDYPAVRTLADFEAALCEVLKVERKEGRP